MYVITSSSRGLFDSILNTNNGYNFYTFFLAAHSTVTVHPCAPSGLRPSAGKVAAASSGHASAFQSRNSLSKRFRYPKLDEIEIDDVLTGGADVLIK
jgi:hypothetical protein